MAYDYSKEFLRRNAELVAKVIKIVQSGEVLTYESDAHKVIKTRQALVNNVLAGIARNMPELADIRTSVRCWTDYKNGIYRLYVGTPQHRVPGVVGGKQYQWTDLYKPAYVGDRYVYANELDNADEVDKFVGIVMNVPAGTTTVEAKVPEIGPDVVDFFNDLLNTHGWKASSEGNRIILTKVS